MKLYINIYYDDEIWKELNIYFLRCTKYVIKNVFSLEFFAHFVLILRVSQSLIPLTCMTLLFTYRVNVDIEAAKTIYDDTYVENQNS